MAKGKNIKKNKIKQQILQVVLLSLIIFTIIFFIYEIIKLAINPTDSFLIEKGTISKDESTIGYIIRDEKVIKNENNQTKLVKIKNEGERVAVGEAIFRYEALNEEELNNKIKNINEEIQKSMEGQIAVFSSDIKALDKQIESKISNIKGKNNIQTIKEYKNDINGYIIKKAKIAGELSPSGSYISNLIEQRTTIENELYNNSQYKNATESGVLSYRVDGLEEILTPQNLDNITSEYLNSLDIATGQVVATSDTEGKIINNFECYIAISTDSEEAKNAEVNDRVSLRLSSDEVIDARIFYINQEEKNRIIIFKLTKNVEHLSNYRKISLDIIWWKKEGLRIPNKSIIFENGLSYVIRKRVNLYDKILVKILRENENYSIIANYETEELENMNFTVEQIKSMKKINIYDEILSDPDLEKLRKELN